MFVMVPVVCRGCRMMYPTLGEEERLRLKITVFKCVTSYTLVDKRNHIAEDCILNISAGTSN
jgi:hypothetical protein